MSYWKKSDKFTYMVQPYNQADNSPIFQTKLKAWKYLVKYENGALMLERTNSVLTEKLFWN